MTAFFADMPGQGWWAVPVSSAGERYRAGMASLEDHFGNQEDMTGERPDYFYVHNGAILAQGVVDLTRDTDDDVATSYVVDGNLSVDGLIIFDTDINYTSLLVTGSVYAKRLLVSGKAEFFVGGSIVVEELLICDLEECGVMSAGLSLSAPEWILASVEGQIEHDGAGTVGRIAAPGAERAWENWRPDYLEFSSPPIIGDTAKVLNPELLVAPLGHIDASKLRAALFGGLQVFR